MIGEKEEFLQNMTTFRKNTMRRMFIAIALWNVLSIRKTKVNINKRENTKLWWKYEPVWKMTALSLHCKTVVYGKQQITEKPGPLQSPVWSLQLSNLNGKNKTTWQRLRSYCSLNHYKFASLDEMLTQMATNKT